MLDRSSLKSSVLKGICGNGKCSKETLPRSHVTAKDSSSQLTTRHSHNKWCDERLAWTQCHAGHICFPRAYLHVSALHFYLNSLCMHKSAPNYLFQWLIQMLCSILNDHSELIAYVLVSFKCMPCYSHSHSNNLHMLVPSHFLTHFHAKTY